MASYSFSVFSFSNNPDLNVMEYDYSAYYDVNFTIVVGAPEAQVTVTDNDDELDDHFTTNLNSNSAGDTSGQQYLTGPVSVDGLSIPAGTAIYSIAQIRMTNLTTGQEGYAKIIHFGPANTPIAYAIAFPAATIGYPLGTTAGDTVEYHETVNFTMSPPNNFAFGDVDYAELRVSCFTHGTLTLTLEGARAIEMLEPGDLILTRDHGYQPLRWIGSRRLDAKALADHPNLRPIRIRAGAIGNGVPQRDLVVSPQHRILVRSDIARRMFDSSEVLIAAKHFLRMEVFEVAEDMEEVRYSHLLFDEHEIVFSEGTPTESLYTGEEFLKTLSKDALQEIFTLFPELRDRQPDQVPPGARAFPSGRQARRLAMRHTKSGMKYILN